MRPYREKHEDPRRYVNDAWGWLEDAESALSIFIDQAEPQIDTAWEMLANMECARDDVKRLIKKWQGEMDEITEDLPELPEDDYRNGGR